MSINKSNIEEYIFDYLEGNLNDDQLTEFNNYVNSDIESQKELKIWKQTYVVDNLRLDSSEFSSLKKSKKMYYWLGGLAAAFLLGLTTTFLVLNKEAKKNEMQINVTNKKVMEEPLEQNIKTNVTEKVQEKEANKKQGTIIATPIHKEEVIEESSPQIENMETIETRNINFDSAQSDREIISKKVNISTKTKEDQQAKKAVDVIELNSEGF